MSLPKDQRPSLVCPVYCPPLSRGMPEVAGDAALRHIPCPGNSHTKMCWALPDHNVGAEDKYDDVDIPLAALVNG